MSVLLRRGRAEETGRAWWWCVTCDRQLPISSRPAAESLIVVAPMERV